MPALLGPHSFHTTLAWRRSGNQVSHTLARTPSTPHSPGGAVGTRPLTPPRASSALRCNLSLQMVSPAEPGLSSPLTAQSPAWQREFPVALLS